MHNMYIVHTTTKLNPNKYQQNFWLVYYMRYSCLHFSYNMYGVIIWISSRYKRPPKCFSFHVYNRIHFFCYICDRVTKCQECIFTSSSLSCSFLKWIPRIKFQKSTQKLYLKLFLNKGLKMVWRGVLLLIQITNRHNRNMSIVY